jgi:dienelactone hydrolase
VEDARVPGGYLRFRIEKDGYEPVQAAFTSWYGSLRFDLVAEGTAPPGMVRVPADSLIIGRADPIELPAYWLDRFEVTNGEFQEFVDAGGYRDPQYWQEPLVENGRRLSFDEAMARLTDATGRPGPATWELGRAPEGLEDLPVGGVSWYEASAYARWAGKSLPTVYHWRHAAGMGIFADILTLSNFDGGGPAPVGRYQGLGPYGSFDMAGNLKEWCSTRVGELRYLQGGAWDEARYTFADDDARHPFDRGANFGFRCVRYDTPPPDTATGPVDAVRYDFAQVEPVSDEIFEVFADLYAYEPFDLDARVEETDEDARHWRRETVSFDPAYEGERVLAHLFLPRNSSPPWQAVIFRPGGSVNWLTSIEDYRSSVPEYLPRSGRVVVVPAYWGTLERRGEGRRGRERLTRQVQDLLRTVDYLETRPDIDVEQLAYVGLSAGGEYGALFVAMEQRFKAAVLLAGGFHDQHMLGEPRENNPWHYAPRVHVPTLMVNGDNDFTLPIETAQKPLFNLLGTDPEHKRHVVLAGGHIPFEQNAVVRETLDWLDRYLGPVETLAPR